MHPGLLGKEHCMGKQPLHQQGGRTYFIIFWFLLPFTILYSVFTIWPVMQGLVVSLHRWGLMGKQGWVGLENYQKFLSDRFFWQSMRNTTLFVIMTVPLLVISAFFLAVLANRPTRFKRFLRASYYLPSILSVSVVSFITIYMASPYMGFLNQLLHSLHILPIGVEPMWLSNTVLVRTTLVVTTVWWTLGFSMLLFLSALQDIPEQLYEAAELDGASSLRMLVSITIPILRPTFALVTFLQIIASFKVFGQIYLISGGGPGTVTRPIIQYIYTTAFTKNNLGYASAMSYALFIILIGFSLLQMRIQNKKD